MHMTKIISICLACVFALTSCSSFSKSSRQQRKYEKYVRRSSVARMKQRTKLKQGKTDLPPPQEPSAPVESTETGPQAIPADG